MSKIPKSERQKVFEKYNGHCAYCGCEISFDDMQVDYLIPLRLAELGRVSTDKVMSFENYMPACRTCNHYKWGNSLEGFRKIVDRIPKKLIRDNCTYKAGIKYGVLEANKKPVKFYFEKSSSQTNGGRIRPERAIEILDPTHRECYSDLPDGMEQVNEACRMGAEAIKAINPMAGKQYDYKPTNAEVLTQVLAGIVQNGADEDNMPNVDYETWVTITGYISCPYTVNPLCALDEANRENPKVWADCDCCKANWLMKKFEG
jgi:hypothetical protein